MAGYGCRRELLDDGPVDVPGHVQELRPAQSAMDLTSYITTPPPFASYHCFLLIRGDY